VASGNCEKRKARCEIAENLRLGIFSGSRFLSLTVIFNRGFAIRNGECFWGDSENSEVTVVFGRIRGTATAHRQEWPVPLEIVGEVFPVSRSGGR